MTKMCAEIEVSKSILREINFNTEFTITSTIKGKKIKKVLSVVGICSTGKVDLREK